MEIEKEAYALELSRMLDELSGFDGFEWHRKGRVGVVLTGDHPRLLLRLCIGETGIKADAKPFSTSSDV